MSFNLIVLYPAGKPFDLEYYKTKHMPLASKVWGPFGLKSWNICTLNEDSGYQVSATLVWESKEGCEARSKESTDTLIADIPNYTEAQPLFIMGDVVKESS